METKAEDTSTSWDLIHSIKNPPIDSGLLVIKCELNDLTKKLKDEVMKFEGSQMENIECFNSFIYLH